MESVFKIDSLTVPHSLCPLLVMLGGDCICPLWRTSTIMHLYVLFPYSSPPSSLPSLVPLLPPSLPLSSALSSPSPSLSRPCNHSLLLYFHYSSTITFLLNYFINHFIRLHFKWHFSSQLSLYNPAIPSLLSSSPLWLYEGVPPPTHPLSLL